MTIHRADFEGGLLVKHRYFVALKPPPPAVAAISRHAREAGVARPNAPDRLHMTLFITDDYEAEPEGLVEGMRAALDRVRADAFDIALARHGHFGGDLVPASARPLRRFQAQLAQALAAAGARGDAGWAFNPHVTLGYGGASPSVMNQPIRPIAWRVSEFELVRSLLRLTIHRTLGRWPLIEQPRLL